MQGFALSEDLPLINIEHLPRAKAVAAGAVDDARPDRWGERVIQYINKPKRLSLMEYLYYAGDDRFGALGVSTSSTVYLPSSNGPLPRRASLAEARRQRFSCRWRVPRALLRGSLAWVVRNRRRQTCFCLPACEMNPKNAACAGRIWRSSCWRYQRIVQMGTPRRVSGSGGRRD